MKDTKKLYETIMASVAKEVKKALNEGEYRNDYSSREDYEDEGFDIQADTMHWTDGIEEFLNSNINSAHTLPLFATLQGLDQLDYEEVRGVAESIMIYAQKNSDIDFPTFDEVFIDPVATELQDIAEDWCADVIREHKIDAYDMV